jgi:uncharacterized protein with ParB-like and HNH nuclease domain
MEAAPVNIIQYFDGSKQGVIPLFQRPYSWEPRDWSTLWDDLMAQYETADRSNHFMGAVVTVPVKSVPVGVTKHLVIDGQQRLTTLSLMLAAIRDKATKDSDEATAGIIGDFLVNRHYKAPDDLKLVPTQADRSAFNAVVYRKSIEDHEESRVVQAYRYFCKKLDGQDLEDQPLTASQTLQAIQQSLQVVMINLGEADDPYLIFESLNHKGKPLNQADLVRNYVLMRFQHSTSTGGEQEVVYEDFWRPMETRLQGLMSEFLRHYGMRGGRNVRKGDIYMAAKLELDKLKTASDVRSSLADMKTAALAYQKFLHPAEEADPRVGQRFQAILELASTVFYPLLIRLYRSWESQQISVDSLLKCLDLLEGFYVRRLVCGVPTNALNKITLELCLHLPPAKPDAWLLERLTHASGSRRCPSDPEFFEALVVQRIYPRRKIARYVLIALEEAHQHKEPVDTTSATMEHVMPQTLSEQWKVALGSDYAEIHDRWLDTLGNLTLTGYNPELGNATFDEKKQKLQKTHFELSRSLLSHHHWGASEIEARGKKLADIAMKRWCMH